MANAIKLTFSGAAPIGLVESFNEFGLENDGNVVFLTNRQFEIALVIDRLNTKVASDEQSLIIIDHNGVEVGKAEFVVHQQVPVTISDAYPESLKEYHLSRAGKWH